MPLQLFFSRVSSGVTIDVGVNTENLLHINFSGGINTENLLGISYLADFNTENLLHFSFSGGYNTENLLLSSIIISPTIENTPTGAPRDITGSVNTKFNFNYIENNSGFIINDVGNIDYKLPLASGLGYGEISELFYEDSVSNTENSYYLSNFPFPRFDVKPHINFIACRRLKAINLKNNSANSLYLKVPHYNSLDITLVPPSGETVFSNMRGWPINSGEYISVSGSGAYSIAFLG